MSWNVEAQSFIVADATAVTKFLRANRMDLLAAYASKIVVTDHVRARIVDAKQQARFARALADGKIHELRVAGWDELVVFGQLAATGRLGPGEQAALALAIVRGCELVIDTNLAMTKAIHDAGLRSRYLKTSRARDILDALVSRRYLDARSALRVEKDFAVPDAPRALASVLVKRASGSQS